MSLFGLREQRSTLENPQFPLTSPALIDAIHVGDRSDAGVRVTPERSLHMSAVYRAVNVLSSVLGSTPLGVYGAGTLVEQQSVLLDDPHPDLTPFELWRWSYVSRLLWGNAYFQKVRDGAGRLNYLYPISADLVKVTRVVPSAANPQGKLFQVITKGVPEAYTAYDIFHLPGFGYDGVTGVSPIRMATQAIGMGMAAEEYGARFFGNGSMMSGVLQTEQRLDQVQAEALKSRWQAKVAGLRNSHEVAVLDAGAKFQSMTVPNTDAQFLESRDFQVGEIERFFGVPPFLMFDTEKSTSWGTGLEQQTIGWVMFDLIPSWFSPTEQRVTKELCVAGAYAKYKVQALMRGDSTARSLFYTAMSNTGAFSANDIRQLEDLPPVPGGEVYLQMLNMGPYGAVPAPPAPPPASDNTPDPGGTDASSPADD